MNPKQFVLNGEVVECACIHEDPTECAGLRDFGDCWIDKPKGGGSMNRQCECSCHSQYEPDEDWI